MQVLSSLQAALDQAVADGVFPGAVLAVRHGENRVHLVSAGLLSTEPVGNPVTSATIYDLASLTKPLATVTSLALLIQTGRCHLDDRVADRLTELRDAPVGPGTLRQLLSHSSGLPGWRGFYERLSPDAVLPSSREAREHAGEKLLQLLKREALVYGRGERSLYSDLGFMLLGLVIERLSGSSLNQYVAERIVQPSGANPVVYLPTEGGPQAPRHAIAGGIAPTEYDPWRGRLLCGEVHDENAAALGGVAGHAGLFGTAEAIFAVTGNWLRAYHGQTSFLESEVVREFTRRQGGVPGSSWALGWDTPSAPSSSGQYFSPESFGHLGYTGTSIWIDPRCGLEVVLLSNRVHPSRKNEKIRAFRPAIHDLVYQEFEAVR